MTQLELKQQEYIRLLEDQLEQISFMSKIELGDDVINKFKSLRGEIEDSKKYVPFVSEVEEFNQAMGKPNNYIPTIPSEKEWRFVYDFVLEELEEYREACESGDIVGVLDAMADLTYVATGNGVMLHGLKNKILPAYAEVQASNMSKVCQDEAEAELTVSVRAKEQGEPCHYEQVGDVWVVYRTRDRKVMKALSYFRPNLEQFFTTEELQSIHEPETII